LPQINGRPYSWASLAVVANNTQFYQVKSASFKNSMERGILEGTAQGELGVTKGKYKPEAAFELALDDAFAFKQGLGDGYLNVQFHVTLSFGSDDGTDNHVVDYDARLKEDAWDGSSGTEPMTAKFPLQVIGRIIVDGLDPVGQGNA
jgi:hypothetical protein